MVTEFILVVLAAHTLKSYQFSQAKSEEIYTILFCWERDERKLTHSERIWAKMIRMWNKKGVCELFL